MWGILYGQCTNKMKDAVKSAATFKASEEQYDVVELLAIIKKLSYGLDDEQYKYWNQQACKRGFTVYSKDPMRRWPTLPSSLIAS